MSEQSALARAVRTVEQKIVALLAEFRQLEEQDLIDLQRLTSILSNPAPDEQIQSSLFLLLFEYFESAIRKHFVTENEYQKLQSLTQRRQQQLRQYIRVEQQLRLQVDSQESRINMLHKLKEDRNRLANQLKILEAQRRQAEMKLQEVKTVKHIESQQTSKQLSRKSLPGLELGNAVIERLSQPKKHTDRNKIKRGSSFITQHKLSLPFLKQSGRESSADLLKKLDGSIVQERKHTSKVPTTEPEHKSKLQLLRDMNILIRASRKSVVENKQDYKDSHMHAAY